MKKQDRPRDGISKSDTQPDLQTYHIKYYFITSNTMLLQEK